jgi:hypothetical protein
MRALLLLAAAIMIPAEPTFAAEIDNMEFDVIAVIPRSPDVQPYFLSIPSQRHKAVPQPELANPDKSRKTANAAAGFQKKTLARGIKPLVQSLTEAEE